MHIEHSGDDSGDPYVGDLDALWLYLSDLPRGLSGPVLRRSVFAAFTTALQSRWDHGGYWFSFAEQPRRPDVPAELLIHELLRGLFPGTRDTSLALTWCEPPGALDDFLDRWLFFRRSRPYVAQDDVPAWMMPALREPWAACVRELIADAPDMVDATDARATVLEASLPRLDYTDHAVALVLVAGSRVALFYVGLCTD